MRVAAWGSPAGIDGLGAEPAEQVCSPGMVMRCSCSAGSGRSCVFREKDGKFMR